MSQDQGVISFFREVYTFHLSEWIVCFFLLQPRFVVFLITLNCRVVGTVWVNAWLAVSCSTSDDFDREKCSRRRRSNLNANSYGLVGEFSEAFIQVLLRRALHSLTYEWLSGQPRDRDPSFPGLRTHNCLGGFRTQLRFATRFCILVARVSSKPCTERWRPTAPQQRKLG